MKSFNDAPLPEFLTIRKSPSGGLGLFVKKNERLFFYQHIGITHYIVDGGIICTPLGGFIKYSDKPNCILSPCDNDGKDVSYGKQTAYKLTPSVYSIHGGEELTLDYRKYEWIFSGDLSFPPIHKQTLSGAGYRYGMYTEPFKMGVDVSDYYYIPEFPFINGLLIKDNLQKYNGGPKCNR